MMARKHIKYRQGYKYQLAQDYEMKLPIRPRAEVDTQFIAITKQGDLTVKSGYAWDGPSGLPDTDHNLRASLVHDALYQLMRMRKLARNTNKDKADRLFQKICREDGVLTPIAYAYYVTLKKLGNPSTDPKNAKKILIAP